MSPLFFYKVIGYGILIFVGAGIAFAILSAVATIAFYLLFPVFYAAYLVLSVVTYPITLILRHYGYKVRSIFEIGASFFSRALGNYTERHSSSEYRSNRDDGSYKSQERSSYNHQYTDKEREEAHKARPKPKESAFDPWDILGVARGSPKESIKAAFKKKMMSNHPDKVATLDPELQRFATKRTVLIKRAYDELIGA